MDRETERALARMLVERAALLEERVATDGVLAYLRRPPVRGRPNDRFLQSTLRGVLGSNRRWDVWVLSQGCFVVEYEGSLLLLISQPESI